MNQVGNDLSRQVINDINLNEDATNSYELLLTSAQNHVVSRMDIAWGSRF